MERSEHVSNQEPQTPETPAGPWPSAELLGALKGFRVEWDDGSVGIAAEIAMFVRTAGLGSGRRKLELLTADEIVAILPEERRILARSRVPPTAAIGDAVRLALTRALRRLATRGDDSSRLSTFVRS